MATKPAGVSIEPGLFQRLAGRDGKLSADEAKRGGIPPPPKGYSYTYDFKNPTNPVQLKKGGNAVLGKLGDVAKVAVPIVLAATGVGIPASAAIMAATYAADAKADGKSWKDAAIQGAIGAGTGAVGAGAVQSAGGKVAANAALGGASGAADGGGMRGAVMGAVGGAAGGAGAAKGTQMAGSGWGDVLKTLAKDPETYKALAAVAGKSGEGAAAERAGANTFATTQNQLAQAGHNSDITALLQALQQNESAKMNRAQLGIQAPSARTKQALLGSLLMNAQTAKYQPPPGVRMGAVSGGFDLSKLLANARTAGSELNSQATRALQTGSDIPAYTDATSRLSKSPTPTGYQGAGKLESTMSGAATAGSLLAALMAARNKQPQMNATSRAGFGV